MTTRVFPPYSVALQTLTVNGRTYSGTPGAVFDVPDHDAAVLTANGWTFVGFVGPTSARPTTNGLAAMSQSAPVRFIDTTLGKIIVWDSVAWRDPSTGAAV